MKKTTNFLPAHGSPVYPGIFFVATAPNKPIRALHWQCDPARSTKVAGLWSLHLLRTPPFPILLFHHRSTHPAVLYSLTVFVFFHLRHRASTESSYNYARDRRYILAYQFPIVFSYARLTTL